MITDTELRKLRPKEKTFKVADRDGMYVTISTAGTKSFRYDYRLNGRRETLTIGRYDDTAGAKHPRDPNELDFGMTVSLAEARSLLTVARRCVERGESPSRTKVEKRQEASDALTFGRWAEKYFADKADPKNAARLADSTLAMRRSVYKRYLEGPFGKLKLDEINPAQLMAHCKSIKEKGAAAPAVQVREIVLLVYRYAISQDKSLSIDNPIKQLKPTLDGIEVVRVEVRGKKLRGLPLYKLDSLPNRFARFRFADLADAGTQLSPLTERAFLSMCRQDGVKAALEAFKHTKQARKVHAFWRSRQAA